jgi:UPF0176 protein
MKFQTLLFYKYTEIDGPEALKIEQQAWCEELSLKGRIIVSKEGINATIEGSLKDTEEYVKRLLGDTRFNGTHIKKSESSGKNFPKLSIKVREELVASGLGEIKRFADYIYPEELHTWIHSGKKFYVVDMRNDYETKIGFFKDSILAPFQNFRDLPKVIPVLEPLRDEVIVTVCTGGVRCEKASGYLLKEGFNKVYQLHGGIVTYMEKYPNEDFLGKLYVFDGRVVLGFNTEDPKHVIVGKCDKCGKPSDNYIDCEYLHCVGKRHFISCDECSVRDGKFCSKGCKIKVEKGNESRFINNHA